jgi:uncharacterized protein (TIGR04222 family)
MAQIFPFSLSGPFFLLFYAALALVLILGLKIMQSARERAMPRPRLDVSDPYRIAYLREGPLAAMQVAALSLIDRGILAVDDQMMQAKAALELTRRPIEQELVKAFAKPRSVDDLALLARASAANKTYHRELVAQHLLVSAGVRMMRAQGAILVAAILVAVAVVKIGVALTSGRTNVLFLVLLAAISLGAVWAVYRARLTGLGKRLIADQQALFRRLKQRAKDIAPGGQTNELAILAGVFGMLAVPAAAFPFMDQLMPRRPDQGSSDSGGSDSSSTSSDGDGCGGGGGGCGGCGS